DPQRICGKLFDHFPVLNTTEPRISNCAFDSLSNRVTGKWLPVLVKKYRTATVGRGGSAVDVICRLNGVHRVGSEECHEILTGFLSLTGNNPILIIPFLNLTPSD